MPHIAHIIISTLSVTFIKLQPAAAFLSSVSKPHFVVNRPYTINMPRGLRKQAVAVAQTNDDGDVVSDIELETTAAKTRAKSVKTKASDSIKRKNADSDPNAADRLILGKEDGDVKAKRKKSAEPQRITEKDHLPKLWDEKSAKQKTGSYTFKVISWNVAGLRGLMKNYPDALSSLVETYDPDVICLQETKLQESHVKDENLKIHGHLLAKEGYDSVFNCSLKKGYSGTAIFWKKWNAAVSQTTSPIVTSNAQKNTKDKKKQADIGQFFSKAKTDSSSSQQNQAINDSSDAFLLQHKRSPGDIPVEYLIPVSIQPNMGYSEHDQEGRVLTMDFPLFSLTNVYVPNSGADLQRLSYRTDSWDPALLSFMKAKKKQQGKPVIWLGDLNVAHKSWDCWNDGAKHLLKSAGTTPEEKESFQRQLEDDNHAFVDAFRFLHPTAKGWYTYWSQRVGNREPNKGLRIDYFICDRDLMEDDDKKKVVVRDSYMVTDHKGSDHCPIVLELEIRT